MSIPFVKSFEKFRSAIDIRSMMQHTKELLELELGQTFDCYHASAARTLEILHEQGIPNAKIISFPADGKTAYQDKITPLGWNASEGKITILQASGIPEGFVAADYKIHPFQLIKGSSGTDAGGEKMRIVSEEQMTAGENVSDALVLLSPRLSPVADFMRRLLDLGARGFISDYAMNADEAPDGIQWCNAYTETGSWHITADDRPFIGFSVTPETGKLLRGAISRGEVIAHVECDAVRFETTVDLVTALIPGKRKEEFWIFAHLYEPLSNDNSSGVASAIETARLISADGTPEFSLRLLFGLEHYGFAAYASTRGDNLSDLVIGAIDYDAMYLKKSWGINFNSAGPATAFYGNYFFEEFANALNGKPDMPQMDFHESYATMYDDDSFLGDSTTGVPTIWPIRYGKNFWHNSKQTFDYVEPEAFIVGTAINCTIVDAIINPQPEYIKCALPLAKECLKREMNHVTGSAREHMQRRFDICIRDMKNFNRFVSESDIAPMIDELTAFYTGLTASLSDEKPVSAARDLADKIIPTRLTTGFPFDMANVPFKQRRPLPDRVLYGPLSNILADMDGKKSLGELIRMAEHETRQLLNDEKIHEQIQAIFYLSKYGYISIQNNAIITKDDVIAALKKAGVRAGDRLAVHSSLSNLGSIDGGAATLFEALKEAVGENGTFMIPAFTACFAYLGGTNKNQWYRPYDHQDKSIIWTGALPRYAIGQPGVIRTFHPSHSWCIYGRDAELLAAGVKPSDAPVDAESPLMRMMKLGGKIVHLGSEVSSTTFLHCIEDALDLPGIQDTIAMLKTDTIPTPIAVKRNLPGCRDFYHGNKETIKFFKAAKNKGYDFADIPLGYGYVKVMDMQELFRIGCEIATEDPFIFLCDSDDCFSCRSLKAEYLGRKKLDDFINSK